MLAVWIAGSAYWHVCRIKQLCDAQLIPSGAASRVVPAIPPLVVQDGATQVLRSKENFTFAKNEANPNLTKLQPELDSLHKYLLSAPGKQLVITGGYSDGEVNQTTFTNLGEARADAVKKWLTSRGLPDSLIVVNAATSKDITFQQDTLFGGISFDFKPITIAQLKPEIAKNEKPEDALANQEKYQGIFKPIDLYFPTASFQYIKTGQNQLFISDAKKYLAQNPDKKLWLTGHTDNEDSAEWNMTLSKKRANFVKNQFVAMGLPADRIVATGKGETSPKASNETSEGKRANRRVSIVVR